MRCDHPSLAWRWGPGGYWAACTTIPLELLDLMLLEVDTFLTSQWDAIFQQYPGVHRGPNAGDRRILNARMPATRGDMQYSKSTYHDLTATTDLSNFILGLINKALDCKLVLCNPAHVPAQAHKRQSVPRDMQKIR